MGVAALRESRVNRLGTERYSPPRPEDARISSDWGVVVFAGNPAFRCGDPMSSGRQKRSRPERVALRTLLTALSVGTCIASGVAAAAEKPAPVAKVSSNVSLVPIVGAAKAEFLRNLPGRVLSPQSTAHHECPGGTPHVQGVACGSTTNDQLT